MSIWTTAFWRATVERAVKTSAQSAVLAIGADQLNVLELDFVTVGGFAGGGALLSVLSTLASIAVSGTPSATGAEKLVKPTTTHDDTLRV